MEQNENSPPLCLLIIRCVLTDEGPGVQAGSFAFASYYNDHMVLQQAPQQAVVWGTYPDIGDRIIVKVTNFQCSMLRVGVDCRSLYTVFTSLALTLASAT